MRSRIFSAIAAFATMTAMAGAAKAQSDFEWAGWSAWNDNSLSGEIVFGSGTVNTTITGLSPEDLVFTTHGRGTGLFEDRDPGEVFQSLTVKPMTASSRWLITFDLDGVALDAGHIFAVGHQNVGHTPSTITELGTEFATRGGVVAPDQLQVSFHTMVSPILADVPISYDSSNGSLDLRTDPFQKGGKGQFAFFTAPENTGINRITIAVDSTEQTIIPDHLQFGFARVSGPGPGVIGPGATPVPEPAMWTMMLAGFGLAGLRLKRRRAV